MRMGVILLGGATLAYAVLLLFAGEPRMAVSGALVGTGVILTVTWARGYAAREWLATAMLFVGIALIGSPFFALVILAGAVALQIWLNRRMRSRLPTDLELVDAADVGPVVEERIAALEAAGFRRAGAFASDMPKLLGTRRVVACVLSGPQADRFAVSTGRVVEVVSRFGGRWLLTISSGNAPASPRKLRQVVPRGSAADVAAAHQRALGLLAERGIEPDRFADDEEAVLAAIELERAAIALAADLSLAKSLSMGTGRNSSDPPLRDDERSRRRVDDWLAADAPAPLPD